MKRVMEKILSLPGIDGNKLLIIFAGLFCGITFNSICGNACFNSQGLLGGVMSSLFIIWFNMED